MPNVSTVLRLPNPSLNSYQSVSYTHLDVYKRQAVSSERIHRDMQKVQQRIQDTFTLKL